MTTYGMSAPSDSVLKHFGFTVRNVVETASSLVAFYKGRAVPNLMDRPELVVSVANSGH